MKNRLDDLIGILREEIALHSALLLELAAEAERDGKLNGNELLGFQARKSKVVHAIREQESNRIRIVEDLGRHWQLEGQDLTLKQIIAHAPTEAGNALEDCHSELKRLVGRIRELAAITSANAQARLRAIDATLAVVRDALKIYSTYSEEGHLHQRTPTLKSTSA
ncbi:MAG: flagellar export chaperone FlgN [SAR324 cluster bacterium]|nr:flagellar export chaperone FlgN [SAR324 cluster bacterium]